jgi:hypothetical protein
MMVTALTTSSTNVVVVAENSKPKMPLAKGNGN